MDADRRLQVDPVEAAAIAARPAATYVSGAPSPMPAGDNSFDGAVAAFLNWAAETDASASVALEARGQELARLTGAGLAELAAMNVENAQHLGRGGAS